MSAYEIANIAAHIAVWAFVAAIGVMVFTSIRKRHRDVSPGRAAEAASDEIADFVVAEVVHPNDPGPPARPRRDPGDEAALRLVLPVGRSGWAIAAGYMGLFATLCFPAPVALLLGVIAVYDLRRHPNKHGLGRAIFAILMGTIFTVLLVIFAIALARDALESGP